MKSERRLPVGEEEAATGEGLVGRQIVLRVEDVIWSAENAPPLPAETTMTAAGWVLRDGDLEMLSFDGAARPIPGERYLSPLVFYDSQPPAEWGPLTLSSQLQIVDDRVSPGASDSPVGSELNGMGVEAAASALGMQAPAPAAAKLKNLRPVERIRAVQRESN